MFSKKTNKLANKNNNFKKIVEIQHGTNFWTRLSTSCCTPFERSSFHIWVLTKRSIDLRSHLSIVIYKRKLLLVKKNYIIQQFFKKTLSYKTKFYHPLCMQNKYNRPTNVCSNETMNLLSLVHRTRLRPPQETLRSHVLDINVLDTFWEV